MGVKEIIYSSISSKKILKEGYGWKVTAPIGGNVKLFPKRGG